ncbi:sensor domain-containing diguanylate cyclase [Halomonas llamarensis]|uniref:diguanylate cyclase n=1 Tax=Halomonas llamarensis TaxID=2945104 RepID=A0ABT0SS17_9GAMM|nr:sensor domain-containing diguanylate cyclase [Halomonas llamarensis]MCL7930260.1 sensor domain-containing diguanylate cyclase [Halomonas llamarensis]
MAERRITDPFEHLIALSSRDAANMINAAPIGICITNAAGMFEMVNPAYCEFYGYEKEELLGQHFTVVVPKAYRAKLSQLHDAFIAGNEIQELRQELEVRCKNGEARTIIAEAARLHGDDGAPRKVTYVIDITSRKHLEEQLKQANERLDHLAHHDELTGIFNRRAGLMRLEEELKRCQRYGSKLSVAMYDLDSFKHINDTYGHSIGDDVLKEMTQLIAKEIRSTDFLVRLGGEEFLIIMPEVEVSSAYLATDRLRQQAAATPMTTHALTVTLSAGVASYMKTSTTRLLDRVDKAMYRAKQSGRNKVIIADDVT